MSVRRLAIVGLVIGAATASPGCSAAVWEGMAAGLAASQGVQQSPVGGGRLLVFGGANKQTFLGCLSCSEYDATSVFNAYGAYGSKYAANGLLNPYSAFGSKYSVESACNPYATDPPIVVTEGGQALGRLTVNTYNIHRLKAPAILQWLAAVCG